MLAHKALRPNYKICFTTRIISVSPDYGDEYIAYAVAGTDKYGCIFTDTLHVTVISPQIPIGNDTILCSEISILLDAGIHQSYLWNTGDTTRFVNVDGNQVGLGEHLYFVTVNGISDCWATDSVNIEFEICTNDELSELEDIIIFPNPAKDEINLTFMQPLQETEIIIFSMQGIEVFRKKYHNVENCHIPLNTISPGCYVLRIINEKYSLPRKIIII